MAHAKGKQGVPARATGHDGTPCVTGAIREALLRIALLPLMVLATCDCAVAQAPETDLAAPRPRVALVLSGGGARGLAHIGVLRALRDLHVPVDIVVGTSMGSVVGGAFAAGRSVEEMEQIVRDTDWDRVLADRPARDALTLRRRDEDLDLPSRLDFGVDRHGLKLPPAAAGNAALELALAQLIPAGMRDRSVGELPLPFRSVASDLLSGELVELSDSSLFTAMRASLSIPGLFAPVRVKGRLLVDGGLVRNLPIDIARSLGADVIIAVNVGTPLATENELGSSLGVATQMLRILTEQNVQRSLHELRPGDVLITPELSQMSFLNFRAFERTIQAGDSATRTFSAQLTALAVSPERYAEIEQARRNPAAATASALPLGSISIDGTRHIAADALLARSGLRSGAVLTAGQIREAAARLYGRADVADVEARIEPIGDRQDVTLHVQEADWARSRLRLGLELSSDFAQNNTFSVVALHVLSSLNSWDAELRTLMRIGTLRALTSEWWQPLGAASQYFVAPSVSFGSGAIDVFAAGRRTVRTGVDQSQMNISLGRQLSDWGDMRIGITRILQHSHQVIPEDPLQHGSYSSTNLFVQAHLDTLEPIAFPIRGWLLAGSLTQPSNRSEAALHTSTQLIGLSAFNLAEWGGHFYAEWAHANGGSAPASLGGFLRLSGAEPNSISGASILLGRLVLAKRISALPATLGGAVRVGFSLEMGGASAPSETLRLNTLRRAGSAFAALDTRFGPLYFAAGATEGKGRTLYLFLGPIW